MEQDAFIKAGKRLYGEYGWKTQLAKTLGMSRTTIHRYSVGELAVPGRVALAMQALEATR